MSLRVQIQGLHDVERFQRPLEVITGLFFEEYELVFESVHDADIAVALSINGDKRVHVHGILTEKLTGNKYEADHEKDVSGYLEEKDRFKQIKYTVFHVYLTLLQQYTGLIQQWGVLTGIRPVKLLHQKLRSGLSKEEAHRQLRDDYLVTEEKIELMQEIVDRQLTVVPDLYDLAHEVSIYIGIPFCPTKCAYCTFPAYAIGGRQGSVDAFLAGLHYEMREVGRFLKERGINITTIYYGGGTPTSITAEEMDRLYAEMYQSFPNVERVREITVEAGRPDTITPEKLNVLKKWNIDRISINPQSYIQETLKAIGRHHTVDETIEKFHLAREMGMNNINMDLIIGLPGEGTKEFSYTLAQTEKLMPESLTVHTLSFKRASEMTKNKAKYKVADRDEISEMMKAAQEWTKRHGYVPYYLYRQKNILGNLENVGYALPGKESIYNIMIMEEQQSIIGLGCGASSKFVDPKTRKITRFANPKEPKVYNENFVHYTNEKLKMLETLFG
ncbi:coproporphyrinogen III oxidase [Geobacillus sp. NFOSA3]|jgi:coproporphyrinogen dehydrogenase HemZ|uniref:Coproporphyrinogen III oxidase n=2 Tax=Anoxybacillaceae TaxID=3120669 RepID=A0A226QNB5_9BACL|nr:MULTISPECIES: coproporphyrinogen III oxidase [Bacillaceae]NNU94750.1 coproporphyrinogen III oxidase [Geobacillus sp. NFOSA3]OQP01945.1 coproporphyrinogen III oxidase [Geobacillus sp. 44C]PDM39944.1 coproporphyrinogen III oxidase [Parageobacillus yumthangensis]MED4970942.1 coproporphyrinogen III oxidase [Parageobacillus toebii]MED4990263.1 coproporphyrinogen III oxidase [Parageobacillus toebii]